MANKEGAQLDTLPVQLYGKNPDGSIFPISDLNTQLGAIQNTIAAIRSCMGIASDLRVTLLSGTVTTVSSLSNVVNIGSVNAKLASNALSNTLYIQSNNNNIA